MLNSLIALKNAVVNKLGPFLGYAVLIIGGLVALSLMVTLVKVIFGIILGLLIFAVIVFGISKVFEWLGSRNK